MDRCPVSLFARSALFASLFALNLFGQTTINVPADQPTIQAAINAAQNGDTVLVAPGTYYENVDFLGKAITVTSSGGAAMTTIDGNNAGSVVIFRTNEGLNSILSGFTITHGKVTSGLGGGGVEISNASPIVENNTITNNQSCGDGGGIFAYFSSAIIRNNTVSYNGEGGCSGADGGGVAIVGNGSVQLLNNVIVGNSLLNGGYGGGVGLNGAGTPTISGNTIQGNSVYNDGGGLSLVNDSTALVIQNLITGNSVRNGQGGGVYISVPSGFSGPTLVNNTVANNSSQQGAAVYVVGFDHQSQFVNNLMISSGAVEAVNCDPSYDPTPPIFKSNDALGSGGVGYYGSCASAAGSKGNISADPLFKDPVNGDFHLQPGSPAIDAGDITNPSIPALDLGGAARLGDDSGQCNFVIDLGVYESHPAAPGAVNLSSTALGFPDTAVGNVSSPLPLLLTSTGQGCFRITGFNLTGDFGQTNSCGSGVSAGQSCTVQAAFIPTAGGLRTGTLSIPMNTNPGTAPGPIALSGTGLVPHGTPSPSSVNFPAQIVNTFSAAQTIILINGGGATLIVSSVSAGGDFTQTNNCSAPIAPGASCSIQVTFIPSATGQRNGSLSIASNSSPAIATVSLAGSGLASQGSFSPTALNFSAPQVVNTTSPSQNVTLTNVSASPLNLSGFSVSGDFAQTNNCPATLAPNASCSIQVTFTPTATGQRTGTLSGPALPNVPLTGSGLGAEGTLSPATLSFALQVVNISSPSQNVVLTNIGTLALNISGFSISGDYAQTNNCPGTLASGASCSIEVTFTPTVAGGRPGTLSVSSDSAPPIPALAINGTGAPSSQATINVPADQPTIQAAINAAADGATVMVAPGTYVENINFAGKAITLTTSGGAASTIIDGNAAGSVVTFNHGESSGAVLNGFTIQNGRSGYYAGGIEISGASPQITNNIITGNGGTSGVAVDVNGGSPLIQGNTITDNVQSTGTGGGGAIFISAASGVTSNVSVIGNVITNNHLDGGSSGGGISLNYYASALIENNYIAGNSAYNGGGGIDVWSDVPVTIVGNVIVNNSSGAGGDGGGIYLQGSGQVLILNNTLYGNASNGGTSEIATWVYPPNAIFKNNIVYATSGTAISCPNTNGVLTATNNIIYSVDPATIGTCAAFAEANGNLFTEPGMVNPAGGDFHLHVGSPAIDAGVSDPNLPQTDIGGTTRVLDGNNDGVAVVDIGAYEFVPGAAPAGWAVLAPLGATFPVTAAGNSTGPINFTLLNNGNAPLSVNSISVSSPFAATNNCPAVLPVRNTCLIQVTFAPTTSGSFAGMLSVATDGANGAATAPLNGTGTNVVATITPASFDFGQVTQGTSSSVETFEVTNTSNVALVISNISLTGPFLNNVSGGCYQGIALPPGAACGIGVTFHPTGVGSFSGTLVVSASNGAVSPTVVNLDGSGAGPVISVSPTTVSFGALVVGSSQMQVVMVSNTGNQALTISSIQSSANFAEADNCGSSIAPGGSCSINITFTPSAVQQYSGTLTISSNTVVGNTTQSFLLSGAGGAAVASVSPSSLAFGQQLVGTSIATQTVTITNTGSLALIVGPIRGTGDFQAGSTCHAPLTPGRSCTIDVTFTPSSRGSQNTSLPIYTNDPASPAIVSLSGTGIAPVASVVPAAVAFGSQLVGSVTAAQAVTLSNTGDAVLSISTITVPSPFAQANNCGGSLTAGASCTINVTFSPTARGAASANLSINVGAPAASQMVILSGTGVGPVLGVSPASLTFNSQVVGTTSAAQSITVSNTGETALSLNSISAPPPFAQTNNCGNSLASGATCTISVTFAPTLRGTASGSLTVNVGAPATNQTISLVGTGIAPLGSFSPTAVTFTLQRTGTTSSQVLTLSNTGDSVLTISSIGTAGQTAFSQTNNCPATLAPGASCSISAIFQPQGSGTFYGDVVVIDDSGGVTGKEQDVLLTGTGGASTATRSPLSLTFPTTKVGTSTGASPVSITNSGTMSLNISSISTSGDFSQSNNCGSLVAPGGSCVINVIFTPSTSGSRSGLLGINSDAQYFPYETVPLSGMGAVPIASISPGTLTFATTSVGTQSSNSIVTLSNTGVVSMSIGSIATTGDFAQNNNCPVVLVASSSCTISVTFVPSASGTRSGILTIADDAFGGSQSVSLSGSATDFVVTLSPTSVSVHPGQSANYNATVTAIGGAYNQTVSLTCSGLPVGATCSLTPTSLIPGSSSQNSKLKITTSNGGGTPAGTYTIIVTGVVNNAVRSATATLIVK